jgi:hypothetical protein
MGAGATRTDKAMNNRKSLAGGLMLLLASMATGVAAAAEAVTVFKTPWCGCCHEWAEALGEAGYEVKTVDLEDLTQTRKQAGVPADMLSCHVAAAGGYFLEGHVPLEAIGRLMSERPDIAGLAVPGMPQGALGMNGEPEPYDVYAVPRDPKAEPYVFLHVDG